MSERPEQQWFLISRHLSGETSEEESRELMQELQQNPGLQQQFDLLSQLWQVHERSGSEASSSDKISRILQLSALEKVIESADEKIQEKKPVFFLRRKFLRYAATVVGLVAASFLVFYLGKEKDDLNDGRIIAKNGSRTRALLPDGSTVWLNAGSTISYEPGFNSKTREVILQGEAYFDVVKQPDRPFIVHAGAIDIKVLGTAFNVKSYPDEKTVETTLIRGLVQINRKNESQPIFLRPHQKIVLPASTEAAIPPQRETMNSAAKNNSASLITEGVSVLDSNLRDDELIETAWVFNRLEFRGDNFTELARKLERWYNISIQFTDEQSKELQFNGSLENETVQQALVALQAAASFEFTIKGNEIFIGSQKETLP